MKDYFFKEIYMKKTVFSFLLCLAVIIIARTLGQAPEKSNVTIYLPDRNIQHLIPVPVAVSATDSDKVAKEILDLLSASGGEDSSFIRYLKAGDAKVNINGEIATVTVPPRLANAIPKDRDGEKLFIYHIVNSLCSAPDIKYVRFLPSDKATKELFIFADERELFSANYGI